ncbi:PaaX family transcriptional regulator C-terminal domain-containing protein [Citricoccus sp.]|uniref:PaaX family transcriptional regulator n=1 Tax=Citricoccus sp. TaxID=1978372 RepID=UPI0028BE8623|nr:PaaX family transcriptional regulator C-terminal domain-containing protein [Citricoccus sp.]
MVGVWSNLEDLRSVVTEGQRGRSLLVTLMAEYWSEEGVRAPSGALVDLMEQLSVSASATRTLLSRLTREGRLVNAREGRRSFYALSPSAHHRLAEGFDVIRNFGSGLEPVDRGWTMVLFSIPEDQRSVRQQLRKGLSWMGFAPLYDGAWVSSRARGEQALSLCRDLGVESASVVRGSIVAGGTQFGDPTDAWDLDFARQLYVSFTALLTDPLQRLRAGHLAPVEAMRARTETINVFRGFPRFDPDLPLGSLTPEWPRQGARDAFVELYEETTDASADYVRSVVEAHSPAHVPDVSIRRL